MMGSPPPARRSEIMAAIRSKGTRPEIAVRRYLRATGPGYHLRQVPVSPERRIDGHDR
jgi:G:T-mismatch repair DNA endonuclease (very short patch repair protein)